MGENVYITDSSLVFLTRMSGFTTDEQLFNITESAAYTGLNTFQISGVIDTVASPAGPPLASGAVFDSITEAFHLSPTSGNPSGFDISATTPFTIGFFGKPKTTHTGFKDWYSKYAAATNSRHWTIETAASGSNIFWEFVVGQSNGSAFAITMHPYGIGLNEWQSVVGVVDPTINTATIYVSGIATASYVGLTVSPGPSGVTGGAEIPIRIGSRRAFNSQALTNPIGGSGADMAEVFFMQRALSAEEVAGFHASGFIDGFSPGVSESDTNDTQKDNIGDKSAASTIQLTAWNANNAANPSGSRHMTSGYHPSWLKILNDSSDLNFGRITQHTSSGLKAITFRNTTSATAINNIRFWMSDMSAFAGLSGWNIAQHIDSKWLPNITLPSGSGVVSKNLGGASTVLQSDGSATISGSTIDGTVTSGESGISQYIYLSFDTNEEFTPSTYGPNGFTFRITADSV